MLTCLRKFIGLHPLTPPARRKRTAAERLSVVVHNDTGRRLMPGELVALRSGCELTVSPDLVAEFNRLSGPATLVDLVPAKDVRDDMLHEQALTIRKLEVVNRDLRAKRDALAAFVGKLRVDLSDVAEGLDDLALPLEFGPTKAAVCHHARRLVALYRRPLPS